MVIELTPTKGSDVGYLSSIPSTILSKGLWGDNYSQTDFAKKESVYQDPFASDLPSFKEPKIFRLAMVWRAVLRISDEVKLNEVALKAVDNIKSLLKISEGEVAELAEISRNTIRNWRKGQGAYPSTTDKLFKISHLISALSSVMNQNRMLTWLNESDGNSALSRLEQLRQSDGVSSVTRQANHLLFPPRPGKIPPQDMLVLESDLDDESSVYAPHLYKPRSRTKVPKRSIEP